jgi:hypothetical protein
MTSSSKIPQEIKGKAIFDNVADLLTENVNIPEEAQLTNKNCFVMTNHGCTTG